MKDFHPAVQTWFQERFQEPTEPQQQGWPAIRQGENVLIAAPTGSGKTLAAFLCAIDHLVRQGAAGKLANTTQVLYVSPLKALANDVRKNLLEPLREIRDVSARLTLSLPEIRPLVRTGDTLPRERHQMKRKPPHILITTPESLFILLTSESGRKILKDVQTVIVDEIHAVARDKRGSHLALSLERLEALTAGTRARPLQRVGLSATQKPVETICRFLTGQGRTAAVVNIGHKRSLDLAVKVPRDELGAVAGNETWEEIYDRLAQLIRQHRTTLVFVNTRRLAERLAHHLAERLGEEAVAAHHGSLSREIRLDVEERLKSGTLKAVVATASLELGIDVGSVDLVCQIGSTRSIALALQRIGRSGHWKGAIAKGRIFAMTRDELLECAALAHSIRSGELDEILIRPAPLDILAQQIVAAAACEEWKEEELFQLFRRAAPYAGLTRQQFDSVVTLLAEGISTTQGRRGAYLHRDRVNGLLRGRRGARLAALTSGGAIPDNANYLVKADPEDVLVGTLDEDFAVESMRGDIFLLGTMSWRIRKIEAGTVRVEDAHGAPPTIPFWRGEAPARTSEVSRNFSDLRETLTKCSPQEGIRYLEEHCALDRRGAEQAVEYVHAGCAALGQLPTQQCVVAERFFDEGGGMQLVLHSPFGSRINKAWGLALRKRFCRSFNFELQAAATENGILISLREQHSFPLESVFSFLSPDSVREVLTQALLAIPLFTTRWRWNASRALAVLRFSGGRKVPPPLQRMRSDDLLAAVFPQQAACAENIQGDISIPDHPLVVETIRDCLTEAMDLEALTQILRDLETGRMRFFAVDTREPSPFSHEILSANPYAFLDDAPLEERRARAVQTRRTLVPGQSGELGMLDAEAIERVAQEAWPPLEGADDLHDALLTLVVLRDEEIAGCRHWADELMQQKRVYRLILQEAVFWAAAERMDLVLRVYERARVDPAIEETGTNPSLYAWQRDRGVDREGALRELVRSRLQSSGPVTAQELVRLLALERDQIEIALAGLEGEGQILRGSFRPGASEVEWCDRRLLARIHRLTLGRLRREIEPVSASEFIRFLFRWQHLAEGTRLFGEKGLVLVLEQLQGFEIAAAAWESFLLSRRIADYDPDFLDQLCLSGNFVWARLTRPSALDLPESDARAVRPTRLAPIAFFRREQMGRFLALRSEGRETHEEIEELNLSHPAREVLEKLHQWGACFFNDLVRTAGRLPVEVEGALWELVASGLITADGFDNLRALVDPKRRRGEGRQRSRRPRHALGRWTLLRLPGARPDTPPAQERLPGVEVDLEPVADQLLRRWGIVFRDLLARESLTPPWRDLLVVYRRLELRGKVRGGRFVAGFSGEQFALPEALDALRSLRKNQPAGESVRISAADPLNLTGILTPGPRVRPHPETVLVFRDGVLTTSTATAETPGSDRSYPVNVGYNDDR